MNPDIKAQWVAALRSGEYTQTKGYLHRTEPDGDTPAGYCCLGVLCDIAEKAEVVTGEIIDSGLHAPKRLRYYDGDAQTLPGNVVVWSGIGDENPIVEVYINSLRSETLATLNDSHGYTFAQLADVIEAQL